jgi:hypothetical protein
MFSSWESRNDSEGGLALQAKETGIGTGRADDRQSAGGMGAATRHGLGDKRHTVLDSKSSRSVRPEPEATLYG